jgi:hypothetical protein
MSINARQSLCRAFFLKTHNKGRTVDLLCAFKSHARLTRFAVRQDRRTAKKKAPDGAPV